jgi:rhamnogalacturonan endolyase
VNGSATGDTDGDGIIDYETQNVRNAPRYISVIDGMTGREKASVEQSYNTHYNRTNRASLMGDEYNKHVGHMGVFFHDGIHPAVVMEWHMRGTGGDHHYYNLGVAYDFSSGTAGELKELFNEPTGAPAFHQIRVGDVDGDGCDEITYGSMAINNDGTGLYTTGMGHGDALHLMAFYPDSTSLQLWDVHENKRDGSDFRDARTGRIIFQIKSDIDVGRGMAADIDPTNPGLEMWSSSQRGYFDVNGNHHNTSTFIPQNSAVWWDGDLCRELLDRGAISKYNWKQNSIDRIFQFDGCEFNN